MTLLRARRNIALNHRLLYKGETREIDADVARHYLALYPDALEDVTPKPDGAVVIAPEPAPQTAPAPDDPEPTPEPKAARRRKSQPAVD